MHLATLDFARADRWVNQEAAQTCFVMGGVVSTYDGSTYTEASFLYSPESVSAVTSGGGAVTGTVQYLAVFEGYDRAGNLRQSAPSPPFTVVASSNEIQVTFPCYTFATAGSISAGVGQFEIVNVALYRTIASGDNFYRLTSINQTSNSGAERFQQPFEHVSRQHLGRDAPNGAALRLREQRRARELLRSGRSLCVHAPEPPRHVRRG